MLRVFICEDNNLQRGNLEKIINNTLIIENLDIEIALSTKSPYDIIDYLYHNQVNGLYFLDIDLSSDINGIQLAEQIRKYDPRGFIIFITTHAEMSYLTFLYKVEAMDYIIKDNHFDIENRVCKCILSANDKYINKRNDLQESFTLKIQDKFISIKLHNIIFFETSSNIHKVILHTKNRQIEFYGRIKEIEEKLDDRFIRCHRSYLINKDNIKEIDFKRRTVRMVNGEECLASSRLIKRLTLY